MATDAVLGSGPNGEGTQLWLTNGSDVLTKVAGLLTINRPNLTVESVDKTSHDSEGVMEYMAGLIDPGELAGSMMHVPDSATDALFLEHLLSRETRPAEIREVKLDGTYTVTECNLFLTAYEPDDAPVDGRREASFTAQVSGLPTYGGTVA